MNDMSSVVSRDFMFSGEAGLRQSAASFDGLLRKESMAWNLAQKGTELWQRGDFGLAEARFSAGWRASRSSVV